jgi:GxxExxY protein
MKLEGLSRGIIHDFYAVYNKLGYGFLESVYENALKLELEKSGYLVEQQYPIKVFYDNTEVGMFRADLLVNDLIILELKAAETIHLIHKVQVVNYLKATEMEIGYVLNFGKSPQFSRQILTNDRKDFSLY